MITVDTALAFWALFRGREDAYGTGKGGWVKQPLSEEEISGHLNGEGTGIGIAPLLDDGTCNFAAIDLDEPDFELAKDMAALLPGTSFIERSRSGNAHVWVFFSKPIEAWVARGILREATVAVGRQTVEVFPKQDRLLEGMVGNYINLPYHGEDRPILHNAEEPISLRAFIRIANEGRNDPDDWRKRARWLGIASPEEREAEREHEWGEQPYLHRCAEWIIANRESNPVTEGHRAAVYFMLATNVLNTQGYDSTEALDILRAVNESSPEPSEDSELRRIVKNAERGHWTSTRCDDPLVLPYADPECPIASSA